MRAPDPLPPFDFRNRLARATAALRAAQADLLVVSHLPNLRYLSGLEATAGAGVLTADGHLHLLVDPRYEAAAAVRAAEVGADLLTPVHTADTPTPAWIARHCVFLGARRLVVESRALSLHDARQMQSALEAAGWGGELVETPLDVVEGLRRVKDPVELALLREGGARLSDAARSILADRVARPGRTELEVAAEIDARVRAVGFSRAAFDTIVASGPRSAFPHARPTARRLEAGDVVVLDFGGVYGGYCVDLTRTVSLGHPSSEVDRQYHAVRAAQQAGCAAVGPGVLPAHVDRAARQVLEAAGLGETFGHGTGHGLGLEVHEAPRLARPRPEDAAQPPLEAGVACTIEPGAYVTGRAGIRIEDDVVVTVDGHESITDVPLGWPTAH
ncbi:X-Pro dipeptidase [Luteitalea sp. TBR-22]|uniref:M24 family metallopeptidase n=1 Tax=Luteitalea sp. TBR-22 TaxID=2802971 RepID=UPI001AF50EDB|nr:Xaa-Pro peptidase family protein [Luteitalea sp. TBR-22]BCS33852.1 X-Pro dipeptidase [Luteitalea sp. TBR-22]